MTTALDRPCNVAEAGAPGTGPGFESAGRSRIRAAAFE